MQSRNSTMATKKMKLFIICICFMAFFYTAACKDNSGQITWWCNQTPYPEPCKHYMTADPQRPPQITASSLPISRTHFRDRVIQVAMNQAIDAFNRIKQFDQKSQSRAEKAAWTNCVKFYDNTIFQFKKIIFSHENVTPSDIQTWLSAALTNIHLCQNGLSELQGTRNLTQLISNTLAINRVSITREEWSPYKVNFDIPQRLDQILPKGRSRVVVAQDGLGDFRTIKKALDASKGDRGGCERFLIYVRAGVYNEYIEIGKDMRSITMIGDGIGATIITGSRSNVSGYNTVDSATVKILGDGFIAHGITFQNTAGPRAGQAVALLSSSDHSVFYKCSFEGYQDTLFVVSNRQFYQNCDIFGTMDFIFGNAAVVLQNCNIFARKPLHGSAVVITAQARNDPNENTGISIMNSRVSAANELIPVIDQYKVYLGRPWQHYSRVVYMQTLFDILVDPEGWLPWDDDPTTLRTLFFGEFMNYGIGSSTRARVKWPGFKVITDYNTAEQFTVTNLIDGLTWLPNTGVPFISDLK